MTTPINDKETFKPFKPEQQVDVTIFKREAVLIYKLRKISFGKIMVHKLDGKIVRIEPTASELIDEEQEIEL
jgi:hypothetical protein